MFPQSPHNQTVGILQKLYIGHAEGWTGMGKESLVRPVAASAEAEQRDRRFLEGSTTTARTGDNHDDDVRLGRYPWT